MSGYERRSGGEVVGFIIILIGFSILMRTMGIFPSFPFGFLIQRFWLPALFIGIGILLMSRRGPHDKGSAGIFFIIFGALFLMGGLNPWGFGFQRWIGPAILIWIGIAFLTKGQRPRREHLEQFSRPERPQPVNAFNTQKSTDSSDFIQATVFLGSFNRNCTSQQFRGGDVTAIMAGAKIDLRDAQISENTARVNVFALMGGIEIQVPVSWVVESRLTPILGECDDKTRPDKQGTQRLIIDGTALLGSVTISN
jgi:predicted membrane protein